MVKWYPYFTQWENNIAIILHIYEARDILYYFTITKTINLSNEKWKILQFGQYPPPMHT